MTAPRITTREVKERCVWAAGELMKRAGCDVIQSATDNGYTLTVVIPPDDPDPHGSRLKAIRESPA